jgi:hypothetical protein
MDTWHLKWLHIYWNCEPHIKPCSWQGVLDTIYYRNAYRSVLTKWINFQNGKNSLRWQSYSSWPLMCPSQQMLRLNVVWFWFCLWCNNQMDTWHLKWLHIYWNCEPHIKPWSWQGVLDTTLCDKVCQWFAPGTPVFSINETDLHDNWNIVESGVKRQKPN